MDLVKKSGLFEVETWNTENDDKRKAKHSKQWSRASIQQKYVNNLEWPVKMRKLLNTEEVLKWTINVQNKQQKRELL